MPVVVYSGGMDSFTLLHHVLADTGSRAADDPVVALSFNYGQRHRKELLYAQAETARLGLRHEIVDLSMLRPLLSGSALTQNDIAVPEGHYAEESMKATVVPGRNTIMLAIGLGMTEALLGTSISQPTQLYYGAHSGDHAIYPDCRPDFIAAMTRTVAEASGFRVQLRAPFMRMNKYDILRRGQAMGLTPEDYARSWTCYQGGEQPCGKCGACVERAEAFADIGWPELRWHPPFPDEKQPHLFPA